MYSALCVILHVPKSGSGDWFKMFAKASKNSGIFVATILPAILPKFLEPMCSEPPSKRMNATVGFLSTSFTAPWKPISPIWCVPQECGQPEMCKRGSLLCLHLFLQGVRRCLSKDHWSLAYQFGIL